jgi:hypothetical protein
VRYASLFAMVAVVVISIPLAAQEVFHSADVDFARFSYLSFQAQQGTGLQKTCFAVSPSGEYRFLRAGKGGIHGKLSEEDLKKFKALIESEDFRSISGDHSGLIRTDSESFAAEIPWLAWQGHGRTQRLQWLNADGLIPFPVAVGKVVEWMQNFNPKGGKSFDYADYPDVCPSRGLQYVQPSVAER